MKRETFHAGVLALLALPATAAVTSFEEFTLPVEGYLNGSDLQGGFTHGAVTFANSYNTTYQSWSGFAISNQTDMVTAGFFNQYSVYGSGGAGGSSQFAVGYWSPYETSTVVRFSTLTSLIGTGASFNNTTYAALEMINGGSFGSKKFGGASGNDADWFRLTIEGYAGGESTGGIDFYLADYRFADNSQDYIVQEWTRVDFSSLGSVDELRFSLSSSDNGIYGMNTPAYFAMDDFMAVPEPSVIMSALAGLGLLVRRRR